MGWLSRISTDMRKTFEFCLKRERRPVPAAHCVEWMLPNIRAKLQWPGPGPFAAWCPLSLPCPCLDALQLCFFPLFLQVLIFIHFSLDVIVISCVR